MKFEVNRDRRHEYRWRFVARNGRTIADSGEGYSNKSDCLAGIQLLKDHAAAAPVEDTTVSAAFSR